MSWFRFHDKTLNNPKAQRLPAELFKAWVNCLCIASQNDGVLPPMEDIAFSLRLPVEEAEKRIVALVEASLIDRNGTDLEMHDWNEYQYKSDVSSERVRRFRQRQVDVSETENGNAGNGSAKLDGNVSETAPEQSRADTEQSRADRARKTRIPKDWEPDEKDREHARKRGLDPDALIEPFRNYHLGKGNLMLDWHAAWRTWCGNEVKFAGKTAPSPVAQPPNPDAKRKVDEGYARLIKKRIPIGATFSIQKARELVSQGLVTAEECSNAGYPI